LPPQAFSSLGAHFNPAVTLAARAIGDIDNRTVFAYIPAQVVGAITGVIVANLMFDLDAVNWSSKDRSSANLVFAEVIATLGLLLVIFGAVRGKQASAVAFAVGGYIGGAYFFTSSTSFANPAVTIGRISSDTFAGIAPASAPAFVAAQLVGLVVAVALIRFLWPGEAAEQKDRRV